MTTLPEEAVKAGTLWAVNIHGPDDLIAAPDYMSAVRMANAFNAWWLNLKAKQPHNDALDARMWAVPTDWPGNDAQGHADELSKPHPEYQWLRDASALPHLPGVGVKTLPRAPKDQSDIGWTLPIHLLEELRKEADSWADEISIEGVEAIALSTERRILSALEPSAARDLALEEAARECEKRGAVTSADAIRALSSPDHADSGKVEGDGWMPIESAPNNKAILVHYDDGNIELISADDNMFSWIAYTVKEDFCTKPTHWCPLPTPPNSEVA